MAQRYTYEAITRRPASGLSIIDMATQHKAPSAIRKIEHALNSAPASGRNLRFWANVGLQSARQKVIHLEQVLKT